jgi:hypothetical protein
MTPIFILIAAAVCAALNAIRGSGQGWMRPVVGGAAGLASWLAGSPILTAGVVAAGLWFWLTQPWGRWYMLGQGDREWSGPANWWERPIERIADRAFPDRQDRADALAWLISGTAFALPLVVLASPFWLALTPLAIAIYAAALSGLSVGAHVRVSEAGKGALIGLLAVLLAGCAQPRNHWADVSKGVAEVTAPPSK